MANSLRVLLDDIRKNRAIYLMVLPVVLYFFIFKYFPMYGAVIAFKDFSPAKGIWGSDWVGFQHFTAFFKSYYFIRVLRNTFLISIYNLLFGFPAPIILAILLNEIRQKLFKSIVQTVSYLPHFISIVVISGLIIDFTNRGGIVNSIIMFFGGQDSALMNDAGNFRTIFVSTSVWQELGWSSIIYLAALSGINPELYEAVRVDGAGRFRQIWSVTLPGLIPTIMILLILRIGGLMEVGFEKVVLLYNPNTYETADVISSFVYREGLAQGNDFSYTTAVGLFQSMINFILLISANSLSRRFSGSRLW
ncbi:putative aldouronate transport system permease protein [Paenibacillus sp. V4I3]|uniref:ABC transporter permease n=1 Tax=unclassified Paenibacillus TaxID=185978 RepID=UPI00277E1B23|nr:MULTISPECIES: ABC transporter permease subunit [unclassified Paenibacillus]MDQ0872914.1 putative aldouronate transport system permease protein [Paenibacillus sp. V4I3]MDQ0891167.1 putative aldouronate transport system permease protein [Paenibacillus sp. V4I9]